MPELPQIPAQDFFFGLASAGVLLWTLMFLARSQFLSDAAESRDDDLFYTLLKRPDGGQLTFLASLFGHILLIAMMPWVERALPGQDPFDFDKYDAVLVQLKVDDSSLRLPADLAEVLPEPAEKPSEENEAESSDEDDPGVGNGIEAPKLAANSGGEGKDTKPGKPEQFEAVVAETKAPSAPEAIAPEFEAPKVNAGQTAYDLAWAPPLAAPDAVPTPGLPLEIDGQPARFSMNDGLPTDLAPTPNASDRPALAELTGVPGLGDFGSRGYGYVLGAGGDVTQLLAGDGLRELIASLEYSGGGGAGRGVGNGMGAGDQDGASGRGGVGYGSGLAGDAPAPRKLHGIILISNEMQSMPEADGVLSGNPVYTVYVDVPGFRKKWILQVCMPRDEAGELRLENGGVLRVLARSQLDPPYATRRSGVEIDVSEIDPLALPPRIVVYFRVDPEGRMIERRIVAGLNEQMDNRVLASLEDWEFHPAFHDGQPVAVEALFGIPLR